MPGVRKQNLPETIANLFMERIRSGEWGLGERIPTIREIADELKVSPATASSAIRALVGKGWLVTRPGSGCFVNHELKMILDAQLKSRHAVRGAFASGKARTLYFFFDIVPNRSAYAYFHAQVLCSIQSEIEKLGWNLKIGRLNDSRAVASACSDENCMGVVYMMDSLNFPVSEFKRHGVREVLFGMAEKDCDSNYILPDNYSSGFEVAHYLYRRGHRRIAFVNSFPDKNVFLDKHFKFRLNGVIDFLKLHELEPDSILPWDIRRENGEAAVASLLDRLYSGAEDVPTALIVATQGMAVEICRYAETHGAGKRLLDRISIITFEDTASDAIPELTYASFPPALIAREAVAMLQRIAAPLYEHEHLKVLVGMHIIERGSVKEVVSRNDD